MLLVILVLAVVRVEPRVAEVYHDGLGDGNWKLFNRTKRTGGELYHSLVGMWLPVNIPQAETAYNYKEPVDNLPQYKAPKQHYEVSLKLLKHQS